MSLEKESLIQQFGVELEVILAFHEDRLIPVLRDRGLDRQHIVKNLSNRERYEIGIKNIQIYPDKISRPSHRGWALQIVQTDVDDWQHRRNDGIVDFRAGKTNRYRTYWAEPLHIVQRILQQNPLPLNIKIELSTHPANPTYNDWKVSNDCTLVPLSKPQMLQHFSDRISSNEGDNWDTTGVEIVTPPMRSDNPASFQEIEKYLTKLRGDSNSNYGICTSKYAGLHVHIGFGKSQDSQDVLKILQHLAYILVQAEPLIIKFFPPYRDGQRKGNIICANEVQSNRASVINWEMNQYPDDYTTNQPTLQDLAISIFQSKSISALKDLMHSRADNKGYQANFKNMALASVMPFFTKRTMEFRIHESTTDSQEIEMWVKFCLALCRTAERQSEKQTDSNGNKITKEYSGETEFTKYKNRNIEYRLTTIDLFDLLEFNDELRKYWQARYDRYHDDQDMELPTPELDPEDSGADDDDDDDDSSDNNEPKGKGKGRGPGTPGPKRQSPSTPKSKGSGRGQASPKGSPATPKSGSKGKGRTRATGSPSRKGKIVTKASASTSRKSKSQPPPVESKSKRKTKSGQSSSPDPDTDVEPKTKKQKRSSTDTVACAPAGPAELTGPNPRRSKRLMEK